jgi:integrase
MGKRRSRGEGSIFYYEQKGLWVAEITINGKTRRKYEKTQKEARSWLLELRKQAAGGMIADDNNLTFGQFIDRWFEDVAKPNLRPSTIITHESIIRNHIKPEIGNVRLSELTPLQLQTLCSQKLKNGLSNRTVKYIRTIIHQVLDKALEWGLVARNVADSVKTPAPEKKPVIPLTKEQVWKLLDILQEDRLFSLYVVFLGCGLRRGEALALTWDCIDFNKHTIYVNKTIQFLKGMGLFVGEPKSESSRRVVAMPDFVFETLLNQYKHRNPDSEYVFTTSKGSPFFPRNIVRHFKKALKKAGLPETTRIHDLRHFFVSWLLAQNTPPKDVQVIVGHAQFSTTVDIYGHMMPEAYQDAADKMNGLFDRQ